MSARLRVNRLEKIAILLLFGFDRLDAIFDGRRVTVVFADPTGEGSGLLRAHDERGIEVNSQKYAQALTAARHLIFDARG